MDEAIRNWLKSIETVAPHVWAVAVRQAQVEAWLSLVWFVVSIAVAVVYVRGLRTGLRKYKASGEDDFIMWDGSIPFILLTVLVGIPLMVLIPMSLDSAVRGFANPEYAAMMALLRLVS